MSKPAEILVFEFLKEEIEASAPDSVIYELELHDTIWQKITKPRGIRISDCVSEFSPQPGGGVKEYDANLTLSIYAKIEGKDKTKRQAAIQQVFDIQAAIYDLFFNKSSLNNRVCDSLLRPGARGYDVLDSEPYAVANIPLLINPTGKSYQNF